MSAETLAIIFVAGLFGLFVILLLASLIRARVAAKALARAGEGAPAVPEKPPEARPKPKPISRREFVRRSLVTSLSLFGAEFGAASLAFLWPSLRGGFGSIIDLALSPDDIKSQIQADNQPFYFGAGRVYVVPYEGDAADTEYAGLVNEGLMALYQRCVHLGCRVPFCEASQWFECPCHGSKYNLAGEWKDGPAPRGMDRFGVRVEDGVVKVDTTRIVTGPPRGIDTTRQDPEGPFCVNIGSTE
jgi:cytochrome b6-f complex iron-sulfur subunit